MIENVKNQHIHYEKYNELKQEKNMWRTIALLAIVICITGVFVLEKQCKEYKEFKHVYQIGLETIRKNQANDSIARKKTDSTYWIYLKTKRTGRN